MLFPGAKDEPKRRIFSDVLLMLGEPTQVELHLAFVFGFRVTEFEVDGDQALETAMVEKEIADRSSERANSS